MIGTRYFLKCGRRFDCERRNRTRVRLGDCFLARQPNPRRPSADNAREEKRTLARKHGHLRVLLLSASESGRGFGSLLHHQYSKSQPLSVGIFFALSPSENAFGLASVASWAARFSVRFTQIPLSVISRDASARNATLFIFNDLQAAGSISNLVGRWGIGKRSPRCARIHFGQRGWLRTSDLCADRDCAQIPLSPMK